MAAAGLLATPLGLAACFLGIWLGDLGLYALARYFGRPFLKQQLGAAAGSMMTGWQEAKPGGSGAACWFCWSARFVPGLRLPTYLIAGTLSVPFLSFAVVTALMGLIWVPLIFVLVWMAGTEAVTWYAAAKGALIIGAASVVVLVGAPFLLRARFAAVLRGPRRCSAGCNGNSGRLGSFYIPVGLNYVRLGLKYRSFNLPTIANPGMLTGGHGGRIEAGHSAGSV